MTWDELLAEYRKMLTQNASNRQYVETYDPRNTFKKMFGDKGEQAFGALPPNYMSALVDVYNQARRGVGLGGWQDEQAAGLMPKSPMPWELNFGPADQSQFGADNWIPDWEKQYRKKKREQFG